jgi:hypothetical protein
LKFLPEAKENCLLQQYSITLQECMYTNLYFLQKKKFTTCIHSQACFTAVIDGLLYRLASAVNCGKWRIKKKCIISSLKRHC